MIFSFLRQWLPFSRFATQIALAITGVVLLLSLALVLMQATTMERELFAQQVHLAQIRFTQKVDDTTDAGFLSTARLIPGVQGASVYDSHQERLASIGVQAVSSPLVLLNTPQRATAPAALEVAWRQHGEGGYRFIVLIIDISSLEEHLRTSFWLSIAAALVAALICGCVSALTIQLWVVLPLRDLVTVVRDMRRLGTMSSHDLTLKAEMRELSDEFIHLLQTKKSADAERLNQAKAMEHLALHDQLTDLPNRIYFKRALQRGILRGRSGAGGMTIFLFNLDRFKLFNDQFGQRQGDQVLIQVAERLGDNLEHGELLARLDSDNFALLFPSILRVEQIQNKAAKLLQAIRKSVTLRGQRISVSGSCGIAFYPQHGDSADELMSCAVSALQAAKAQGGGTFAQFDEQMKRSLRARVELEKDLEKAVDEGQFQLFYQPKIDLVTRKIIGAEALIRWWHPVRGFVRPDHFIPMAEETGVIVPIGNWIIDAATRQMAVWEKIGMRGLRVAINISALQLQSDELLVRVSQALHRHNLKASNLELEITESAVMDDPAKTIELLKELKKTGVTLAIDDFGTGYSSLSYLKQFPVDTLKIDQAFVRNLEEDANDKAICQVVAGLGKHFGMKLVAEGVETENCLGILREIGCELGQGYYIGKPMAAKDFTTWFVQTRGRLPPPLGAELPELPVMRRTR